MIRPPPRAHARPGGSPASWYGRWIVAEPRTGVPAPHEPEAPPTETDARRRGPLRSLVVSLRPRQWAKNLLVFIAPVAAGVLQHAGVFLHALGAFGLFCLAASGTYLFNDVLDAARDREHPVKATRPIAAGDLHPRLAVACGVLMAGGALALAWPLGGWQLTVVFAAYVGLTTAYSLWLKREPVIELGVVAAGFVLRAVAGGVATGVALSNWFVIVTCFASLLVVTGKRLAEYERLGDGATEHRPVLAAYSEAFLRATLLLSAAVTVTAYCLWAFDRSGASYHHGHHPIWFQLTILPFVLGVLYVLLPLENGDGGAPEELVFEDRRLQVIGLVWLAVFAIGVYA